MTEFYQGFWWCFPALISGFLIGHTIECKRGKKNYSDFGPNLVFALACLGCLALLSGFPIFEGLTNGH